MIIIRRYADRLAHWESERDRGQPHAINKGWSRATGEILAYLNSDDTYLPGAVRTACDYLIAHPDVGIVYGDCLAIDHADGAIEKYEGWDFDVRTVIERGQTPIPQPAAFLRRDVLARVGMLDESLQYMLDFDLWLRAGLHFKLVHIPLTLATYRLHSESKTVSQGARAAPDVIRMYSKLLLQPDFPEPLRRRRRRTMSFAYRRAGEEYYGAGDVRRARAMWIRAWLHYPPSLRRYHYLALANTWLHPLRRRGRRSEPRAAA